MKLTKYSDLGLRLLMYLALHKNDPITIKEVSERFAISKNHLVKISHQLTRSGLVESLQGRNGGIRLARPPQDITVEEALRATEDSFDLVECFAVTQNQCVISGACKLTGVLNEARTAFFGVLRRVTLAELVSNARMLEQALLPMPRSIPVKTVRTPSKRRSKS